MLAQGNKPQERDLIDVRPASAACLTQPTLGYVLQETAIDSLTTDAESGCLCKGRGLLCPDSCAQLRENRASLPANERTPFFLKQIDLSCRFELTHWIILLEHYRHIVGGFVTKGQFSSEALTRMSSHKKSLVHRIVREYCYSDQVLSGVDDILHI